MKGITEEETGNKSESADRACHRCGFTCGFWVTGVMGSGMVSKYGTCIHTMTCSCGVQVWHGFFLLLASVPLHVCAKF